MSNHPQRKNPDPWGNEPPRNGGPPGHGLLLWLGLLAAFAAGLWFLASAFPGRINSDFDYFQIIWVFAFIALVSSGLVFARRINLGETIRNLSLWVAIIAVLVLGYSFQDELRFVGQRVRSEFLPGYPVSTGENELVLTAQGDGHFYVVGDANGTEVVFLIDTGATDTVLTPSDALRLGIDLNALEFSRVYETANGLGRGATHTLERLAIGEIAFSDFLVSINEAEMRTSLLGMSFLNRLASFEIRDRRLFLRVQ